MNAFIPPTPNRAMTALEKIVASRAVGTTILSNISKEMSPDILMFKLSSVYSTDVFFLSLLVFYMYHANHTSTNKFSGFPVYSQVSTRTKQVLFILFLIFTRDVENAI